MNSCKYGLAALLLLLAGVSQAVPVTTHFRVDVTTGSLTGTSESGLFTYDDTVASPGGRVNEVGLFTDLEFSFNGINYDETTANTGSLIFTPDRSLARATFGTECFPGVCLFGGAGDWMIDLFPFGTLNFFTYEDPTVGNPLGSGVGTVTIIDNPVSVPEPASMFLFGLGLVGLGITRKKKKKLTITDSFSYL